MKKEHAIKTIQKFIRTAQKNFDKAKNYDNYAQMAVMEAYISGLEMALEVVELLDDKKT